MPTVYQASSLQMEWCLECHREPERFIRPKEEIYNMAWNMDGDPENRLGENKRPERLQKARELLREYRVRDVATITSCSTCHR
jgi:hypothetical protein